MPTLRSPQLALKTSGTVAVLEIYDQIGPAWLGMIDGKTVAQALRDAGQFDSILVKINSMGGSVFEALAIYNILKDHPAPVTARVEGVALSAASLVAMAAGRIEMPANTLMMLHDPASYAYGTEEELLSVAGMLSKIKDSATGIYSAKTGKSGDEVRGWMAAETWFSADEAVAAGLADAVLPEIDGPASTISMLAEHATFRSAPDSFQRLVAMSARKPMEPPPTEPVVPPPDPRAELRRYVGRFGAENGAMWFADGVPWADALERHIDSLTQTVALKDAQVAEANERLASLDRGERSPVSSGQAEGGQVLGGDGKRVGNLSPSMQAFVDGIKLPQS